MVVQCGQDIIRKIFDKRIITKEKSIPPSSIVKKNLPKNLYCSSITGTYAFNLSKITSFKVYFWKSTDSLDKNMAIKDKLLNDKTSALNWSSFYQTQSIKVLNQYTTFVNKTLLVVSTYEECDIVCVLEKDSSFLGACYGPYYLYNYPEYVNNRVILFLADNFTNTKNITEGGYQYLTLVHQFGHGFGLSHPYDNEAGSTIMPGMIKNLENPDQYTNYNYKSFSGYGQNNIFNTVMTYFDTLYFLPQPADYNSFLIGYPETLMPLDLLAIRWLYNIIGTSSNYITKYGVSIINPDLIVNKSQVIVGTKRTITFGSKCKNISFYFSNQLITTSNIEPILFEYNRVIEKEWGFYPKDVACTISVLNFNNTNVSNVFIEKGGIKINLTINCLQNQVLNVYIIDCKQRYSIKKNVYRNKCTKKVITIVNPANAVVNVYFNK
jgi:hypothetical protein